MEENINKNTEEESEELIIDDFVVSTNKYDIYNDSVDSSDEELLNCAIWDYKNKEVKDFVIPTYLDKYLVRCIDIIIFSRLTQCNSITIPKGLINFIDFGKSWLHPDTWPLIKVDNDNPVFSSDEQGILYNKNKTELLKSPTNLKSVVIPNTIESIGYCAFKGCKNLTSVSTPPNVKIIDFYAFEGCINLKKLEIHENITTISGGLLNFTNTIVSVHPSNPNFSSDEQGILYDKNKTRLILSTCNSDIVKIPDSVEVICFNAFTLAGFYDKIQIIIMPKNVKKIQYDAFLTTYLDYYIYYEGTKEQFSEISVEETNEDFFKMQKFFYSEEEPTDTTYKYWHYVNGIPMNW